MSAIFGIYHPDKRPVDSDHLQQMADASAHRGPDRIRVLRQNQIGLGQCMLQTTPQSLHETLPFRDPISGMIITADARIDNREELAARMGLSGIDTLPDSQLILDVYQKWGEEGFVYLIGDFAFTIWDPGRQQLICARDYIGIKPFYYHHTPKRFLFASEVRPLVRHPKVPLTINEASVGEHLAYSFCSMTETLFKGVSRLPQGHYLRVGLDAFSIQPFWTYQPRKRLWYKNKAHYAEHFLEIFEKAVASRLRCSDPVSAEVSGGFDSSSVAGMASKLLRKKNRRLSTYSMVFPGWRCDESRFIKDVVDKHNLSAHFLRYNDFRYDRLKEQVRFTHAPPDTPNLFVNVPLLEAVRKSGSNVVLSGLGGDECFTGSGFPYLDYLQKGLVGEAVREFRYQCCQGIESAVKKLFINTIWPLVPGFVRKPLRKQIAKRHIPVWIADSFSRKIGLRERIFNRDPRLYLNNLGHLLHAEIFSLAAFQYFHESVDRQRASYGIENRYPFWDRRLMEFAQSIPDFVQMRRDRFKSILRHEQINLLPRSIRERMGKAEFSVVTNRTFPHTLFPLADKQHLFGRRNWTKDPVLQSAIRELETKTVEDPYFFDIGSWKLWFVFSIYLWYAHGTDMGPESEGR